MRSAVASFIVVRVRRVVHVSAVVASLDVVGGNEIGMAQSQWL